ncbi:hypothetical protein [Hoeflea sp.]|uniref:hypothetical protein n=1 Tax=Hoeflea sp. TaxID=1940281 RepID=UPI003262263F
MELLDNNHLFGWIRCRRRNIGKNEQLEVASGAESRSHIVVHFEQTSMGHSPADSNRRAKLLEATIDRSDNSFHSRVKGRHNVFDTRPLGGLNHPYYSSTVVRFKV